MLDFYRTPAGRQFIDGTMRRIAQGLESTAAQQLRANDLEELKLVKEMNEEEAIKLFPDNSLIRTYFSMK